MYKLLIFDGISLTTFKKWTEKAPENAPEKSPETGKMLLNRPPGRCARRRRPSAGGPSSPSSGGARSPSRAWSGCGPGGRFRNQGGQTIKWTCGVKLGGKFNWTFSKKDWWSKFLIQRLWKWKRVLNIVTTPRARVNGHQARLFFNRHQCSTF